MNVMNGICFYFCGIFEYKKREKMATIEIYKQRDRMCFEIYL